MVKIFQMHALLTVGFLLMFSVVYAQVSVSGLIKDSRNNLALGSASILLTKFGDTTFRIQTISDDKGRFTFQNLSAGNFRLVSSTVGYINDTLAVSVGQMSPFLDLGTITLIPDTASLSTVTISGEKNGISRGMDKKTFSLSDNVSQTGGSAIDAMKTVPGVTSEEGKILLRGSDKVMILIDGKQTSFTGFGGQGSLANIPASAIEKIEVINNPSSKFDANGNAGVINLIFKKERKDGFNGKVGLTTGLGALWIKEHNLPEIRPQYQRTPKINPSISLNYRTNKANFFAQADNLYTETLNKNEFTNRTYDDGLIIRQQTKRNRNTNFFTSRAGVDWFPDEKNMFTVSGMYGSEKILDHGDEPFFNEKLTTRQRLWQFLEDELKTTAMASGSYLHKFSRPGQTLSAGINYTFHRENEKYFFTNFMPSYTGLDSFALISDEHVVDVNVDYVQPLKHGRFEAGIKFRKRNIPVNMKFKPGLNSPLDTTAGGQADYTETIPAAYGNYVFESNGFELEAGVRVEYVRVDYSVPMEHPVYKADRYSYFQPFPTIRGAYKINTSNKVSFAYTRRVDRPNEVDIRIFPKYDDAEIIKVGNPSLRPQFTNTIELGYKNDWADGYIFPSLYHKQMDGTITRIGTVVPGSTIIYNVFQNAGKSYSSGIDLIFSQRISKAVTVNANLNGYRNVIDAFSVVNKYPVESTYSAERENIFSGSAKLITLLRLPSKIEAQIAAVYQAPDLVPQGKTFSRFSVDLGVKKTIQKGNGELILNGTDLGNTLRIKREVRGNGFNYSSIDYYETQVIRIGYNYKF